MRHFRGLSLEVAASLLGIGKHRLGNIEQGRTPATTEERDRICQLYETSGAELFGCGQVTIDDKIRDALKGADFGLKQRILAALTCGINAHKGDNQ